MALAHSSNVVTNGLVFYYDMENTQKSRRGVPTTNQVSDSMSIYNNVPGDVTASLVATTEYYRGAQVWQLTLTPTTANGVGWLSNANNPGIGVVSNGGGGLANRFTGHAIFYRSTVPLNSTPLFTNYSNISGWGAGALGSNRSVSMGDGWSRGEVLFFSTSTLSDGKYWAINPATATLNVPIVIFFAGPFKEDRNDSNHVAAYTPSVRSSDQSILDLTGNNTITANSLTYNTNGTFRFNGTSDLITIPENSAFNTSSPTVEVWARTNATTQNGFLFEKGNVNTQYALFQEGANITWRHTTNVGSLVAPAASFINTTQYAQIVGTYTPGDRRIYVNGVQVASDTLNYQLPVNANGCSIGVYGGFNGARSYFYNGDIDIVRVYNRALTDIEVQQNFNALRRRYGI
jgi:hypothetical protein